MTITSELANGHQVCCSCQGCTVAKPNHNLKSGTVILEFHGEEDLPVIKRTCASKADWRRITKAYVLELRERPTMKSKLVSVHCFR